MGTVTVELTQGLLFDNEAQTTVVLREPTAGDIFDAAEDSERLVPTPDGYQLVSSPTRMGMAVLARQIVSIGRHDGPLTLSLLKKLSADDLDLLQNAADRLAGASVEVAQRGRSVDVGAAARAAGGDTDNSARDHTE